MWLPYAQEQGRQIGHNLFTNKTGRRSGVQTQKDMSHMTTNAVRTPDLIEMKLSIDTTSPPDLDWWTIIGGHHTGPCEGDTRNQRRKTQIDLWGYVASWWIRRTRDENVQRETAWENSHSSVIRYPLYTCRGKQISLWLTYLWRANPYYNMLRGCSGITWNEKYSLSENFRRNNAQGPYLFLTPCSGSNVPLCLRTRRWH